jgi:aspartyl-tRNA(Asn)/glutamyl-tRNA(Gln) amidotransferase subunit C
MSLSIQEVEHIARLGRLELSDAEKEQFTEQLNEIIHYVEILNQLDTAGVEPTAHVIPVHNVFRRDEKKPSMDPELALANAPDRIDNYFKVPKILEEQ